jgi:hypothetical protein
MGLCHPFNNFFIFLSVFNEFLDAPDFHALFPGQFEKIFFSCHGSIGIHDFTAETSRLQTCQTTKVYGSFRMALPFQDTPFPRFQWKKVARASEIFRLCPIFNSFQCCHGSCRC